jgi:hypothetical protein
MHAYKRACMHSRIHTQRGTFPRAETSHPYTYTYIHTHTNTHTHTHKQGHLLKGGDITCTPRGLFPTNSIEFANSIDFA